MAQEGSSALMSKQGILVIVLLATLITGAVYGGYARSNANNGVVCLSCLSLVPSLSGEWSTEEVDHPDAVIDTLEDYDVVMLFFWQQQCEACDEQWHHMSEAGLVEGGEKDGTGSMAKLEDNVKLYTPEATESPYDDWFATYATPFPRNTWGTPMTVLIFENEGEIFWFSEIGYNEGNDMNTPSSIENLLHEALAAKGVEH